MSMTQLTAHRGIPDVLEIFWDNSNFKEYSFICYPKPEVYSYELLMQV